MRVAACSPWGDFPVDGGEPGNRLTRIGPPFCLDVSFCSFRRFLRCCIINKRYMTMNMLLNSTRECCKHQQTHLTLLYRPRKAGSCHKQLRPRPPSALAGARSEALKGAAVPHPATQDKQCQPWTPSAGVDSTPRIREGAPTGDRQTCTPRSQIST